MARVLFVGQQPKTVDFTNPVLPPGMNAERTPRPWQRRRGAFYALSSFRHRVHAAEMPPIPGIALMIG